MDRRGWQLPEFTWLTIFNVFMTHSIVSALPSDVRARQGGWLFLTTLTVFFLSSLVLYAVYVVLRADDPYRHATMPATFLVSTLCLVLVSGLLHWATLAVRRDRWRQTSLLLLVSAAVASLFLGLQMTAMVQMIQETILVAGNGRGVVGMVVTLAFLHAVHVAGGVIALGIVAVRTACGHYDHERHFAIDFTAHYWHFLDLVWLAMLVAFWTTTGGFA